MTGGSGSLEGEGKLTALPQNLGRPCSFMTEGKRLLKWLQAEGALNGSIVVELFERMRWKRATVHSDRLVTTCHHVADKNTGSFRFQINNSAQVAASQHVAMPLQPVWGICF